MHRYRIRAGTMRAHNMRYKELIKGMVDQIEDENALRFLYKIVKAFLRQK